MRLWQKATVLIALPVVLEIGVLAAIKRAQDDLDRAYAAERETTAQRITTYNAMKACLDATVDMANYRTTHSQKRRNHCERDMRLLLKYDEQLAASPVNPESTEVIRRVMREFLAEMQVTLDEPGSDPMPMKRLQMWIEVNKMGQRALEATETTNAELEKEAAKSVLAVSQSRHALDVWLIVGLMVSAAAAACLAYYFHRDTIRQINALMENISRLSREKQLLPALQGDSELAQLDRIFHKMAAALSTLTERERAVLRNSTELILTVDENSKVLLSSRSSLSILGIEPETLIGSELRAVAPQLASEMAAVKERGEGKFEVATTTPGGRQIDLEVAAHWVEADRSFYCIAHDIGARKELERLKQSFIAMVSHDLRSPISASQAALQVLKSNPEICKLSAGGQEMVDRMLANNTRLLSLISDLLDMEKLEYGLLTLDWELVSFNDLVSECLASVQILATIKSVQIESDDCDTFVYCDSSRMVQVLINLLSNAIKFSPEGSKVEIRFSDQGGASVISVIDHGPGIPEEFMPKIFDRYSQARTESVEAHQGSGLGLAVVLKLVELHGGTVTVENRDGGKGAAFSVRLPLPPAAGD